MRAKGKCGRCGGNSGFSLVEILISILALALISGFILELFIISSKINGRVGDRDVAQTQVMTIAETFKMAKNPELFCEDDLFDEADATMDGNVRIITQYYDAKWEIINAYDFLPESGDYFTIEVLLDTSGGGNTELITASGFTNSGEDYGELLHSAYYEITIKACANEKNGKKTELCSITTGKYFQNMPLDARLPKVVEPC